MHKKHHMSFTMDPKFYEKDIQAGMFEDLEYVRSPFYELAKKEHASAENAQ